MKLYDDVLMDHIKNARNYRVLADADGSAEGQSPICGDEITLSIKYDGNRIRDIGYQCVCCGICMASASIMTEQVAGRDVADGRALVQSFRDAIARPSAESPVGETSPIGAVLDIARKLPARAGCADLPWRTLQGLLSPENR